MGAVEAILEGHPTRLKHWATRTIALTVSVLVAASWSPIARSTDRSPSNDDYQQMTWTERDGMPPMIAVMAKTTDGWLWFGGPSGLYRFDGIRFVRVEIAVRDAAWSPGMSMLYALASGGLAIGTQQDGVIFLKDGRFIRDDSGTTQKAGYVVDIVEDADGNL